MKSISTRLGAGGLVVIALAAAAVMPSAASAQVIPNPDQQIQQASPAIPPILPSARASDLATIRSAQAHDRALSYTVARNARYSNAEFNAYPTTVRTTAVSAPKLAAPSDGFDWGDAAIGGGTITAIVLLGTAGTLVVRRRGEPREA
jgi:hypothetical protein